MTAIRIPTALFAAAALCSGCVAFNVGKPRTFTRSETLTATDAAPFRTVVSSVRGWQRQDTNDVVVGLAANIDEEFARRSHVETYAIREQRRLAVGLYPGGGEIFLMPKGALKSSVFYDESYDRGAGIEGLHDPGQYLALQSLGMVATLGIPHALCTVYSLFGAPFDGWGCHHDMLVEDVAESRTLRKFTSGELDRLDSSARSSKSLGWLEPFSHCGLAGCHKYTALFVERPQMGPSSMVGTERRRREAVVVGPFIAELSIPSLGFIDSRRVPAHETRATFALPEVPHDCTVEAVVSFHADDAESRDACDITRQAIGMAVGRTWRFDLSIQATDRAGPPPTAWRRWAWGRRPASDFWRTAPVTPEDGWSYDHDSRRGWVRLRVSDGMSAEDARRWARENISLIVAEKDILLEPGAAPPADVTYRSLGETLENGILTIEFASDQ